MTEARTGDAGRCGGGWRRARALVAGAILATAAFLLGRTILADPQRWLDAMARVSAGALLGAGAALTLAVVLSSLAWREPLQALAGRLPVARALQLFTVGQIGKYVPGTMWSVVLQSELAGRWGLPASAIALTFGIYMPLALISGLVVGLPAVPESWTSWAGAAGRPVLVVAAVAGLVAAPLSIRLALRVTRLFPGLRGGDAVPVADLYRSLATCLVSWVAGGAHLWVLVVSLGADPVGALVPAVCGFALATSLGALAIVLPDGVGVREGLLALILGSCLPLSKAVVAALLSRLLLILIDVLVWTAGVVSARLSFHPVPRRSQAPLSKRGVMSKQPAVQYDLCVALNYYSPYVSGLTMVAKVLSEGLVRRGWRVAVVTARYDSSLPAREELNGVDVYRSPVVAKIGRGALSPTFPSMVRSVARRSRVLHLHLPMLEAAAITLRGLKTPVLSTYHIDLWLPPSVTHWIAMRMVNRSNILTLRRSARVVVNSHDQARYSQIWHVLKDCSLVPICAPCIDRGGGAPRYRDGAGLHIGFLGRMVPDKGLTYLLQAFSAIEDPKARLVLGGDYATVAGGSVIELVRTAQRRDPRIHVLGLLHGREIDDFYASIDVFALPSVAESFGIAQAEAMMCGIPSVTTDLPGGRYPVVATDFGKVVPPRDPQALQGALLEVAGWSQARRAEGRAKAMDLFGTESCLERYVQQFEMLSPGIGDRSSVAIPAHVGFPIPAVS